MSTTAAVKSRALAPAGRLEAGREYHLQELVIALDAHHPKHFLPPALAPARRILDIGCGAGQTLIAAYPDRVSFGVDVDFEALDLGQSLTDRVRFAHARAEALPYAGHQFDMVIARVSLPYMNIRAALGEAHRVLKTGGDLWATLHPASMAWERARDGGFKSKLFFLYVLANSLAFRLFDRQFFFFGRCESFQTVAGIRRALKRAGFTAISIVTGPNFFITAKAG